MTLALGFLHPALLWAIPLAAVPILIHLLNRRRYQKVRWAAMEPLLAALKRNRRRLRMEQWLILLLRVLAVLLLVFAISRPQLTGSVLGEVRTHHVVLLDDSGSMTQRQGATNVFRAAVERVDNLVGDLVETRERDLFTLILGSRANEPERAAVQVTPRLMQDVREALAEAVPTDGSIELGSLFAEAAKRIEASPEASRAEVYLVTDLRRTDWLDDGGKLARDLRQKLDPFDDDDTRVTLLGVANGNPENLAVTDLRRTQRVATANVPLKFEVEVTNRGSEPAGPVELALEFDGRGRTLHTVEPLRAGESRTMSFEHAFGSPGFHGITAGLQTDRFALDDRRALAIEVIPASRVLLVDGDPGEREDEAETFCLAAALEHEQSGVAIEVIPDHTLADRDLSDVDMVFLCNVPVPTQDAVAKLEQFVADGGGLAVFVGNQVDTKRYNEILYRDGEGLLPAPLTELAGDLDRPDHVFLADPTHPTMAVATEDLEVMFARLVLVGRYMGIDAEAGPPVRVVLRVRDSEGPPLMVARNFRDGGQVTLFTTTADPQWTDWPRWPCYLIVTQELHRNAARARSDAAFNHEPAGSAFVDLDLAKYRPDVVVQGWAEDSPEFTFTADPGDRAEGSSVDRVEIAMDELQGTGIYDVRLAPHAGEAEKRLLARNSETREGSLQQISRRELLPALPETLRERVRILDAGADDAAAAVGAGESWRFLTAAMLAVLLLESVLAWRFGRR